MPRKKPETKEFPKLEESLFEMMKYLKLIAGSVVEQQAKKLVSTKDRQVIWVLCDGELNREEIASKSKIKKRTVDNFIDECKSLGLIEEEQEKGGHPKRVLDYIDVGWKETARDRLRTLQPTPQPPETPQTA
jgi:predicted transcriptional regulator